MQKTHTRTDVLHRIYIIAKEPFKITGIPITGWASNYYVYVDGVLYMEAIGQSQTYSDMEAISVGCHEITVIPKMDNVVVRYSGLIFSKSE